LGNTRCDDSHRDGKESAKGISKTRHNEQLNGAPPAVEVSGNKCRLRSPGQESRRQKAGNKQGEEQHVRSA